MMTRRQILTFLALAAINVASNMCTELPGPFFPAQAEKKGVSRFVIGLIFGTQALVAVVASLILSKYIVQIGSRFLVIAGLFIGGSGTILFGLLIRVPSKTAFTVLCFVIRAVNAVGFSSATTASFAISSRVFPDNVASIMGFLEIFSGLGLTLGPPVGGALYHAFGYEWTFWIVGLILLSTLPINAYMLPNIDSTDTHGSFFGLLKHVKVLVICGLISSSSIGLSFLETFLSLFVISKFHLGPLSVGLMTMGLTLPYLILAPFFGYFYDKYPFIRMKMMCICTVFTGVAYIFMGPIPTLHIQSQLWIAIFMLITIGISLGAASIATLPEILSTAHENGFERGLGTSALVSGLFVSMWSAGMIIGPTLGGYIAQKLTFEWAAVFQGGLSLIIAALLGTVCIAEKIMGKKFPEVNEIESTAAHSESAPLLS